MVSTPSSCLKQIVKDGNKKSKLQVKQLQGINANMLKLKVDNIFPLLNKSKDEIVHAAGHNVDVKDVRARAQWLLGAYEATQTEFVQEWLPKEPRVKTFYALHATVLHNWKEYYCMISWEMLEKNILRKKLVAFDAQLKSIAKYYNASISNASQNAFFKFPHMEDKCYCDHSDYFPDKMAAHAFPDCFRINYQATVPKDAWDALVQCSFSKIGRDDCLAKEQAAKEAQRLAKKARITTTDLQE